MKKLLLLVFIPFFGCAALPAQKIEISPVETAKMTTQERKAYLKQFVQKHENGDVTIRRNNALNAEIISKTPEVPFYLLMLLTHLEPSLDFAKLNKFVEKRTPKEGKRYIADLLFAADEYLATNNMRMRAGKYSANSIRGRIDEGLPYFIIFYDGDAYDKIAERTKGRPLDASLEEWGKGLRKNAIKKFHKNGTYCIYGVLMGYNKATGEYLFYVDGKALWMTESEVKMLVLSFHEPRF